MEKSKQSNSSLFSKNSYDRTLNDFRITLNVTDTELTIQADSKLTLKFYSKKVTVGDVASTSSGLFQTTQALCQGLIDAIDKKEKSAKINITQDAKIVYNFETTNGSQKIHFRFMIVLDEETLDEKKNLQKQIETMAQTMIELEKKIQTLEERKRADELPYLVFEANRFAFVITNSGRTVASRARVSSNIRETKNFFGVRQSITDQKFDFISTPRVDWSGIMAKNPLPRKQKSSFSVRIDCVNSNQDFMIGICPSSFKNKLHYWNSNESLAYCGSANGAIYKNGSVLRKLQFCAGLPGTIIKVTTDLIKNEITFYYNDILMNISSIDDSVAQSSDFSPFLDFRFLDGTSRVSFLSSGAEK